jgi:hypothetical protein
VNRVLIHNSPYTTNRTSLTEWKFVPTPSFGMRFAIENQIQRSSNRRLSAKLAVEVSVLNDCKERRRTFVGEGQVATTSSITCCARWNMEETNPPRHASVWTNATAHTLPRKCTEFEAWLVKLLLKTPNVTSTEYFPPLGRTNPLRYGWYQDVPLPRLLEMWLARCPQKDFESKGCYLYSGTMCGVGVR